MATAEVTIQQRQVTVGPLTIDRATHEVLVSGRSVTLARSEFRLLLVLASDPERVFSKKQLTQLICGHDQPSRQIDTLASRLRRKLTNDDTKFVMTVWGVGYKLVEAAVPSRAEELARKIVGGHGDHFDAVELAELTLGLPVAPSEEAA